MGNKREYVYIILINIYFGNFVLFVQNYHSIESITVHQYPQY